VRRIYAGSCDPTHAIITTSERIGHWTKTRRPFARFSGLESSVHTRYSADFIITTSGFRFSVHTGVEKSVFGHIFRIMSNTYAGGIYVIAATKDGKTEYWVAATPRRTNWGGLTLALAIRPGTSLPFRRI
jgi:hypothetical protein